MASIISVPFGPSKKKKIADSRLRANGLRRKKIPLLWALCLFLRQRNEINVEFCQLHQSTTAEGSEAGSQLAQEP